MLGKHGSATAHTFDVAPGDKIRQRPRLFNSPLSERQIVSQRPTATAAKYDAPPEIDDPWMGERRRIRFHFAANRHGAAAAAASGHGHSRGT